jgi:hypothetical protein
VTIEDVRDSSTRLYLAETVTAMEVLDVWAVQTINRKTTVVRII